jgi:glycosyltransferase involved in cell wall biosynthesis
MVGSKGVRSGRAVATLGSERDVPEAASPRRLPVSFISWSEDDGRTHEIAAALGGEARTFYDLGIVARPLVPIRYLLSALRTVAYLVQQRPRAVIVTNPPIFPFLIVLAYARLAGARVALDSHPTCFGSDGFFVHRLRHANAWAARRAVTTLVTVDELAERVRSWGGVADIVHEAPPVWTVHEPSPHNGRLRVLYVSRFSADEPTEAVLEAAREVPEIDLHATGDLRKCAPALRRSAAPNVTFTGFLRDDAYAKAIEAADVLLVLTSRTNAVNRAAYEAVYAGRPLIVTATPPMRRLFPYAVHVSNNAASIAAGLREATRRHAELLAATGPARALQAARWDSQLEILRRRVLA